MANIFVQMQHEIATASLIDSALIVEGRRRGRGVGHIVAERSPSPTQGQTGFGSGKDKQDKATTGEIWWKKAYFALIYMRMAATATTVTVRGGNSILGFFWYRFSTQRFFLRITTTKFPLKITHFLRNWGFPTRFYIVVFGGHKIVGVAGGMGAWLRAQDVIVVRSKL